MKPMHRCGRTVVGKQERYLDLISSRVVELEQRPGPADDLAGDKGGTPHTVGRGR